MRLHLFCSLRALLLLARRKDWGYHFFFYAGNTYVLCTTGTGAPSIVFLSSIVAPPDQDVFGNRRKLSRREVVKPLWTSENWSNREDFDKAIAMFVVVSCVYVQQGRQAPELQGRRGDIWQPPLIDP